jgi:apolipoprotein N-acyltransferase
MINSAAFITPIRDYVEGKCNTNPYQIGGEMNKVNQHWNSLKWHYLGAILSAFLLWLSYPPVGLHGCIIFALIPLLHISRISTPRIAAAFWGLCGFLFWMANLSWFLSLRNYGVSWNYVILGFLASPLLRTGFFILFGALSSHLWRTVRAQSSTSLLTLALFSEAILWAGLEWLRVTIVPGVECVHIGTVLCQLPLFNSPARWGGEYLLSVLTLLINSLLLFIACAIKTRTLKQSFTTLLLPLLVVVSVFIGAACYKKPITRPFRVLLIQRNTPFKDILEQMLKDGYDPYDSYSTFIDASSPRPVDLVVLAESSLHEFEKDVRGEAAWKFAELLSAKTGGAAVLAGGQSITPSARGKNIQTAAALYTLPHTEFNSDPQVYIKRKLVPFGEYNPFAKVIPALRTASYFVETPGTEVGLFELKRTRISPLICADILVPQYALESARAGAQLLVMISNNIWYSPSSWPLQHGWQTIVRAVETGLPLITAGNVGLTGVVSPNGTATWLCDSTTGRPLMNDAGLLYKTIHLPLIPAKTLYTQFGDMPLLTLSLFAVGFLTYSTLRSRAQIQGV